MFNKSVIAVAVVVCAGAGFATTTSDKFTSYYAFGDSLTDDGKLSQLAPPSDGGRFSNGPVYAEYLANVFKSARLDTGNLALGGATAGDTNARGFHPLSTFGGQVSAFFDALTGNTGLPTKVAPGPEFAANAPNPGGNPLVSVLFGANDLFQDPTSALNAANAVGANIRSISAQGGGAFDDFLVLDLPNLGLTPLYAGTALAGGATAATKAFNAGLEANLQQLESEGINIHRFSLNDLLAAIVANPGGLNTNDACTPDITEVNTLQNCVLTRSADPEDLLFVDNVHPNNVAHGKVGDGLTSFLASGLPVPVPLPASAPLLLAGIAGFGIIARRRKKAA